MWVTNEQVPQQLRAAGVRTCWVLTTNATTANVTTEMGICSKPWHYCQGFLRHFSEQYITGDSPKTRLHTPLPWRGKLHPEPAHLCVGSTWGILQSIRSLHAPHLSSGWYNAGWVDLA